MKKTLITWITGQDGVYLTELSREKPYEVHGIKCCSLFNTDRDHLFPDPHVTRRRFILHHDTLTKSSLMRSIQWVQFDEINNLATKGP